MFRDSQDPSLRGFRWTCPWPIMKTDQHQQVASVFSQNSSLRLEACFSMIRSPLDEIQTEDLPIC